MPAPPTEQWALEYLAEKGEVPDEAIQWMRSMPPAVQELMRRFPPLCLVRANRPLQCPAPGTVGMVRAYHDEGLIDVVQTPISEDAAQCDPEWLTVVGYRFGLTRMRVAAILDGREPKGKKKRRRK